MPTPINYIVEGQGPPVILLHGIAASLHIWEELIPPLVSAGFRLFAADLPGHGDSAKFDGPRMYHAHVVSALLERWIDGLGLSEPPLLVGHSLGGYFSLAYALQHPDRLRGLVLVDPFYSPGQLSPVLRLVNQRPRFGVVILRWMPAWMISTAIRLDPSSAMRGAPCLQRQKALDYLRASPLILHTSGTSLDLTPRLGSISTRTMVIWGERDLTLRPSSFPRLVRLLPNAVGRPIPRCGHLPHLVRPQLVAPLVVDFFNGVRKEFYPGLDAAPG